MGEAQGQGKGRLAALRSVRDFAAPSQSLEGLEQLRQTSQLKVIPGNTRRGKGCETEKRQSIQGQ